MRWRRSVTAQTLPELAAEAERYFPPGTTYSIYSIREDVAGQTHTSYRADAHPDGSPGQYQTRAGGVSGAAPQTHDAGPVTGRIVSQRPAGGVAGFNPATVKEIPAWKPGSIPTAALQSGPDLNSAYGLLSDAPRNPGTRDGSGGNRDSSDRVDHMESADPVHGDRQLGPEFTHEMFATEDPQLQGLLERAAPDGASENPDGASAGTATPNEPVHQATAGGIRLVFAGLIDDAVEAAEQSDHHKWSAAGVLNGGQAGSMVVCYGLGDGSDVERLAEGLRRYEPMTLILAVDPSRKHADTQAWVRRVTKVIEPASLVSVSRVWTTSPGTVHDLGYPVSLPSHVPSPVSAETPESAERSRPQ
ncbi:hypothetical protein [Citricoccus sp. GCM10030269]|uniref:hypothetical protein n=1 Tax=Citricoccus sp. GCM10030269 TaxID=3273388 RepID=UPI003610F969